MSRLEERYRLVLRLLPAAYRQQWEDDMVAAFLDSMDTDDPETAEHAADYGRPSLAEVASIVRHNRGHGSHRRPDDGPTANGAFQRIVQRGRPAPAGSRLIKSMYTHLRAACSLGKWPRISTTLPANPSDRPPTARRTKFFEEIEAKRVGSRQRRS